MARPTRQSSADKLNRIVKKEHFRQTFSVRTPRDDRMLTFTRYLGVVTLGTPRLRQTP